MRKVTRALLDMAEYIDFWWALILAVAILYCIAMRGEGR